VSPTELLLDPAARLSVAATLMLAYAAVCLGVSRRERWRRKAKTSLLSAAADSPAWLVAYASQTGEAETIAVETGRRLHEAGLPVEVVELNSVTVERLQGAERALFVASTYGEGDAPDGGALFATHQMARTVSLPRLHCAVLALGDATYAQYCGFGRALDAWLNECGAQPLAGRIDVDRGDSAALDQWRRLLQHLAGSSDAPDWTAPAFESWRLHARTLLNPGSAGAPLYAVDLQPATGALPHWESGDLAQLRISEDMDRPREYSIASLPEEGCVRLFVRRTGLVSSWLAEADIGSTIALRLRPHRLFRLGDNADRPLILIGNGSGIAGLRGHIKARELRGRHGNWLIYGERNAAHDPICADELHAWHEAGVLQRLDRVFSRDGQAQRYVQDVLQDATGMLREWADAGAAIYVCGSLQGMAGGVDSALVRALGEKKLEEMRLAGRYRRDVY
jgi:sulfite reductase (NADPH) flavoprotein alpha-component